MPAETSIVGQQAATTVLIDGHCVLCSRWYRFVMARDRRRQFAFVAIQSAEGQRLARRLGIDPDDPETFALAAAGTASIKSDAVLRILGALPGWGWVALFRLVPARLRDAVYDVVARNRYRWFGRLEACSLPASRDGSAMP